MRWMPWIMAGALLGLFCAWSPGGLCILLFVVLITGLLQRCTAPEHRRFLVTLFLVGFAIRALLSLGLDAGARVAEGRWPGKHGAPSDWDLGIVYRTREYVRMGDSDYLFQRGYATAQLARGNREPVVVYRAQQSYGWNGYALVLGAFCYLFDFSPHAVVLLNCLIGALLGPVMWWLARAYAYDEAVAQWTAVAASGVPSLILWSATNLKEPTLHLLTACLLLLFARLAGRRTAVMWLAYCLMLAGALAAHATLRSAAYTGILGVCCLGAWALMRCAPRWRLWIVGVGVLAATLWASSMQARLMLTNLFHLHLGHFTAPGICYRYLPREFFSAEYEAAWVQGRLGGEVAWWIAKAAWHYLLEPFPWHLDNLLALLVYPQMLAWYFLLPFAGLGALAAIRWRPHAMLGLLLMLACWITLGGLANGNIGTVFRMRDMVTPFIVLLACAGLTWCMRGTPPFRGTVRPCA